jgi:hypothetical protein
LQSKDHRQHGEVEENGHGIHEPMRSLPPPQQQQQQASNVMTVEQQQQQQLMQALAAAGHQGLVLASAAQGLPGQPQQLLSIIPVADAAAGSNLQLAPPVLLANQQQQQLSSLSSLASALAAAQAQAAGAGAGSGVGGALQLAAAGPTPAAAGTVPGMMMLPSGMLQQQQQQQSVHSGSGLLGAVSAALSSGHHTHTTLQGLPQQADFTARIAAASSPTEVLSVAAERGMGLFTEHVALCLCRLGQLRQAGAVVDGSSQQLQVSIARCLVAARAGGGDAAGGVMVALAYEPVQGARPALYLGEGHGEC